MNQFLSIALKTHFESLKVGGKGENYWQCVILEVGLKFASENSGSLKSK